LSNVKFHATSNIIIQPQAQPNQPVGVHQAFTQVPQPPQPAHIYDTILLDANIVVIEASSDGVQPVHQFVPTHTDHAVALPAPPHHQCPLLLHTILPPHQAIFMNQVDSFAQFVPQVQGLVNQVAHAQPNAHFHFRLTVQFVKSQFQDTFICNRHQVGVIDNNLATPQAAQEL